jgi:hypothetical protein
MVVSLMIAIPFALGAPVVGGLSPLLRTPLPRFDTASWILFEDFLVRRLSAIPQRERFRGAQVAEVAAVLSAADIRHPWPEAIGAGHRGRGANKISVVKVRPVVVAEVAADAATQGDHHRVGFQG